MKLCKDCKHLRRDVPVFWALTFATCANVNIERSMLDGTIIKKYADSERKYGQCGPEGRLFESKK